MVELLQNFQTALGSFVLPLVVAICGLLFFIIIVYATGVLFHLNMRRSREKLKRKVARYFKDDNTGPIKEVLPRTQDTPYDRRDDFLEVLREENIAPEKIVDIYQENRFYDQDKTDLSSRAWWRRAQALHRLKYVSPEGLQGKLASLVYDSSHEVRLIAIDSLSYLDRVPGLDPIELFESFPEKLDPFLVIKLLTLKPDKSFLLPLIDSEKPRLRRAGATLLGQPDKLEFLPLLDKLTEDEDSQVRRRTAESLGRIGDLEALSILQRTSSDEESVVREVSARSLGNISHDDSIKILDNLATDNDFKVRLAAFSSLARFGEVGRKAIGNHWGESKKLAREAIFESYQVSITSRQEPGSVKTPVRH
ncbi:HEAT repeat domain-containing protein [Candidatus Bipolaricaulota bacterium]|nr:HEAT repeat domain-containing protein [Candidatus Bipolaricaulota bacterium]